MTTYVVTPHLSAVEILRAAGIELVARREEWSKR